LFRARRERPGGNLWQTSSQIIITTAAEENNEERHLGAATSNRISVYPGQGPLFRPFYLKEFDMARYAGIDLEKRTMEVSILDGDKIERHGLTADGKGRSILASLLRETDVAGYEVCRFGNRLARMLEKEAGCTVTALNPGDLRFIWKRRTCRPWKKADREDALKMR
jgi:hypothetical protein